MTGHQSSPLLPPLLLHVHVPLQRQGPRENDEINVVWVVDSEQLPFYRAEMYHQFHNGLGKAFPAAYTRELKAAVAATGKIAPTGCLEVPF
jgi:hypothetical protein